jgi:hypothetical protein
VDADVGGRARPLDEYRLQILEHLHRAMPRYLGIAAIGMGGISHMYAEHGTSQKWANVLIGLGAACFAAPTLA